MISKPASTPSWSICSERISERLLALVLICFLASGCGGGDAAEQLLADYRSRVERVLDAEDVVGDELVLEPWPRARERHLEIPLQRIDLIDFLRLNDCGLGALAGMRASSLGRVMTPPERLRYELRFVREGERCLSGLESEDDAELQAFLADALAVKETVFGAVAFNATFGSDVLARHHALDVEALDPSALAGAGDIAIEAVHGLAERAALNGDADREDWNAPWAALDASRYGGRLHRSLVLLERDLDAVAGLVEQSESLCPLGTPSEAARILGNVFQNVYAARVQPYMAGIESGANRFDAALDRLAAVQGVMVPEALAPTPVQRALDAMRQARDRHTRAWQAFHEACGLRVGTRPD